MTGFEPLVGIIGGYGAVGTAAARCLYAAGGVRLRIGGRDADAAARLAGTLGEGVEAMAVDVADDRSTAAFGRGCHALLNCSGPAWLTLDRALLAACSAGVAYADVMDDDRTGTSLTGTAVLGAGLSPGLTAMLPGLLAEGLARPLRFSGCYAGLEPFTRTGALDYVLSLTRDHGAALAEWRGGQVVRGALEPSAGHRIPGLPRPVTAYPYLPQELVRQAAALSLVRLRWYNAFDGTTLLDALGRVRGLLSPDGDLDEAAARVVRASALDAAGRSPYHLLWGRLEGHDTEGRLVRRSILIRGTDGSALTGCVGALVVRELAHGRVPQGLHRAAGVLAPASVLSWLRAHLPATGVAVTEEAADDDAAWDVLDCAGGQGAVVEGTL
ncbi:hypothetical protein ACFY5C_31665 [Streptomyces sp. NPDC012935]|uniref:hypothetical protein n=1 Tax=Streptomyces sp. NPDC012935 TaxID=3364857 RepID=UPI00369E31E8